MLWDFDETRQAKRVRVASGTYGFNMARLAQWAKGVYCIVYVC